MHVGGEARRQRQRFCVPGACETTAIARGSSPGSAGFRAVLVAGPSADSRPIQGRFTAVFQTCPLALSACAAVNVRESTFTEAIPLGFHRCQGVDAPYEGLSQEGLHNLP